MSLSKCNVLKAYQLRMQRLKWIHVFKTGTFYDYQAKIAKEDSLVLAKKMKAHAKKCPKCNVTDENFYGLDELEY